MLVGPVFCLLHVFVVCYLVLFSVNIQKNHICFFVEHGSAHPWQGLLEYWRNGTSG